MKVPLRGADLCPPAGGRERLGAAPLLKKDRAVALSSSVGGLASSCRQSVRRSQPRFGYYSIASGPGCVGPALTKSW